MGLVFRNYNRRIYVARKGSKIALIDRRGDTIGSDYRYDEFEYFGDGVFETGSVTHENSKEAARFSIE